MEKKFLLYLEKGVFVEKKSFFEKLKTAHTTNLKKRIEKSLFRFSILPNEEGH